MTPPDPVGTELSVLETACHDFGMPLPQALREKADELKIRLFLKCIPNDRLKETELEQYLIEVLKKKPSAELLFAVAETVRGPRLSEDEFIKLETRQNGRCALCGCVLTRSAGPQVDHVVPVALRGKSDVSNYQLLCKACNQGKRSMLGWLMGAPFLYDVNRLTSRLRYCALARSNGACELHCGETSRSSDMEVVPIISTARGGRWIFDNVMTVCRRHAKEREKLQYEQAKRLATYGRFQNKFYGGPPPAQSREH